MRKVFAAIFAALVFPVIVASPALAAPGERHGSCERFGEAFATWARGELPAEFGHPGTVMPALARTAPGHAAEVLHAEMTTEVEGLPGTPFCDPHPLD